MAITIRPSSAGRKGRALMVDGYNQALAVLHYAAGRPVFIGTDGLARDAGGSHGRVSDRAVLHRAAELLADAAASFRCPSVLIVLDAPVPRSAAHAALLREAFSSRGLEAETRLEESADAVAAAARGPGSPLLFDLARAALELAFAPLDLLDLGSLLAEAGSDHRDENEAR